MAKCRNLRLEIGTCSNTDWMVSATLPFVVKLPSLTPMLSASATSFEDVDKALTGISVGDPDGGNLTVTLQVSHGTLPLALLPAGGHATDRRLVGGVHVAEPLAQGRQACPEAGHDRFP
jgi:hypothetical protein